MDTSIRKPSITIMLLPRTKDRAVFFVVVVTLLVRLPAVLFANRRQRLGELYQAQVIVPVITVLGRGFARRVNRNKRIPS